MLPPNRQLKRLSEVVDIQSSNFLPNDDETYNYIGLENIESNTGNLIDFFPTVGKEIKSNKVRFEKGMILYGKLRPYLNKVHLAEFDGIATTEILPMQVKKGIDQKYLVAFLKSKKFVDEANDSVSGARMPRVTTRFLQEYDKIPLPPLAIQEKIVVKLDELSANIKESQEAIREQVAKLDELWQSKLSDIFGNEEWESFKLGEILEKGMQFNPQNFPEIIFTYIDISSIDKDIQKITNPNSFIGKAAPSRAKKNIQKGDIVFATTRPNLKNIAIIEDDYENAVASTGFCVLRPKAIVSRKYLFYFLITESIQKQIAPLIRGAQYPTISDKDLLNCKLPLPPLTTQKAIVQELDELQKTITELKNHYTTQLKAYDELQNSILDQAFKGELVKE